MSYRNRTALLGLAIATLLITACSGVQKKAPVKMIATDLVDYLVRCERPFDQVRRNLQLQGYTLTKEGEGWLETDYKRSEKETQRFLLGAISEERLRSYKVVSDAEATKFQIHYKLISHSHPSDDEQIQEVSYGSAHFTQDYLPILRDIHTEVCGAPANEPEAVAAPLVTPKAVAPQPEPAVVAPAPKPASLDFLRQRCDEGDAKSCEFLKQQEANAFIQKRCAEGDQSACDFLKR